MRYLIYSSLFFLIACGTKSPAKLSATDGAEQQNANGIKLSVIRQSNFGDFRVSIEADEKGQQCRLIVYNIVTHKSDLLELPEVEADSVYTHFTNITRAVGFEKLALLIDWQGASDVMYSDLVGYIGDTLKIIYEDPYSGGIKELKRKDPWTLAGTSFCPDSLTNESIFCPLTISLKTGEGEVTEPDTTVLQFPTEAKEPIFAYRIGPSGKLLDYMIPVGTIFQIDTIFNVSRTAILSIGDSIRLQTKFEQLAAKFKVSDAG